MKKTRRCILAGFMMYAVTQITAVAFGAQPNVIFIMADDLGWRDTAVYGSAFYETPHIDALAKSGMGALPMPIRPTPYVLQPGRVS